jgi:hypothetical protein
METLLPSNSSVSDLIAAGKLPADSTFRKLYGTGGMINDSFRTAALANPNAGMLGAAATNSLLNWTPKAPMAMCYSAADPTVFAYNTTDAQTYFGGKGVAAGAGPARQPGHHRRHPGDCGGHLGRRLPGDLPGGLQRGRHAGHGAGPCRRRTVLRGLRPRLLRELRPVIGLQQGCFS